MTHDPTRRSLNAAAALAAITSWVAGFSPQTVSAKGTTKMHQVTKTSVTFNSNGLKLAGDLYVPDKLGPSKFPAIVVGHPASGVKEQTAGLYAQRLAAQGFITLAFDTATQGESEGLPRGVEDPARRVEEFKDAVSFLSVRKEVDPGRIAVLGICASGGYVVPAAAVDMRIKAVATVSGVDLGQIYREGADGKQDPAVLHHLLDSAAKARTAEARGEGVGYFPIFPETKEKAQMAGVFMADGWDYYRTPRAHHPRSATQFTWSSVDRTAAFDGFEPVGMLAPRPLLVVVGRTTVTAANSTRAFERAKGPKELFWIEGASHVDLYDKERFVPTVVAKLADFFRSKLSAGPA